MLTPELVDSVGDEGGIVTKEVVEGDDVVGLALGEDDADGWWVISDRDGVGEGVLVVWGFRGDELERCKGEPLSRCVQLEVVSMYGEREDGY